jgi:hypothetical protein
MLRSLAPEKNRIVDLFKKSGIAPSHAADTQAMLHQRKAYCSKLKCLDCGIGQAQLNRTYKSINQSLEK